MSIGYKHLGNRVLIEHSLVDAQFAAENLLIDLILQQLVFIEGMAYQQAGISHIALDVSIGLGEGQAYIGVIDAPAFIGDHGIRQPEECLLILLRSGAFRNTAEHHPLLMSGQQARNLVVNRQYL